MAIRCTAAPCKAATPINRRRAIRQLATVDPAWKSLAAGPAKIAPVNPDATGDDGDSTGGSQPNGSRQFRDHRRTPAASTAPAPPPQIYQDRTTSDRACGASPPRRFARNRSGRASGAQMARAPSRARRPFRRREIRRRPRNVGLGPRSQRRGNQSRHRRHRPRAARACSAAATRICNGPYARNVQHGLEYLLSVQGADGNLGGRGRDVFVHVLPRHGDVRDERSLRDDSRPPPRSNRCAEPSPTRSPRNIRPPAAGATSRTKWATPANSAGN